MKRITKPEPAEYPPYASIYIDLVPNDGRLLEHFESNATATAAFIESLPASKLAYRYEEGKWTIKEIMGHLIDDERVYVYRALRFARNDATALPGFDQDHFTRYSNSNSRSAGDLLQEFALVRRSTIAFFSSLDDDALVRSGVADGNRASVRALGYHIAGHELRHLTVIRERYLIPNS